MYPIHIQKGILRIYCPKPSQWESQAIAINVLRYIKPFHLHSLYTHTFHICALQTRVFFTSYNPFLNTLSTRRCSTTIQQIATGCRTVALLREDYTPIRCTLRDIYTLHVGNECCMYMWYPWTLLFAK